MGQDPGGLASYKNNTGLFGCVIVAVNGKEGKIKMELNFSHIYD